MYLVVGRSEFIFITLLKEPFLIISSLCFVAFSSRLLTSISIRLCLLRVSSYSGKLTPAAPWDKCNPICLRSACSEPIPNSLQKAKLVSFTESSKCKPACSKAIPITIRINSSKLLGQLAYTQPTEPPSESPRDVIESSVFERQPCVILLENTRSQLNK